MFYNNRDKIVGNNIYFVEEFHTNSEEIQHEFRHIPDPDEPRELAPMRDERWGRKKQRPLMDRRWS